ncbi:MAG: flavodoxin domain-containing protein [Puniceicoccales bacterium]
MSDLSMTVLYGTETGNCKGLANKVAAKGEKNGVQVAVHDLATFTTAQLAELQGAVLIIISTWDDGMPPPKAKPFCDELAKVDLDLSGIDYTVLALGDTEYPLYCECGKQIDSRLAELGAKPFLERTDLGSDFLVSYIGWSKRFWKTLAGYFGVGKSA